ncbi:hypothetical protein NLJ89_g3779 [Agrocybe chaxingu]|uniref:NADH:flavin oxidoreductase/NADH oxidase N-terminal domain-containing protein n=1 Tax=Agrocybe chaxingu TaxID=84603 RepID=A0A9W8K431_9AGAR|nr:hypothetical protein NLJ89_g3779 [Agrocybe chaxingu]
MATRPILRTIQVGAHTLKNCVGMAALTRNRAPSTYPTDLMKEYYVQRTNAALIVSEGILITRQGTEWPNAPGIWDEKHIAGWKNIVAGVHEAGSKIYAQLWHLRRAAHPDAPEQKLAGVPVYAPSAIAARGGKSSSLENRAGVPVDEIDLSKPTAVEDPWTIVAQFKQAALNAKQAGFDEVELHGAGGYLVNQFLDSGSNKRTDQWGGNVENRSSFGLEVLKALTEVFGRGVGAKLVPGGGFGDVGMPLQETLETYSYFISEADKPNLAYICLMRYGPKMDFEYEAGVPRATKHDVVASYRHLIKNAKAFVNVDVTPEEGDQLISESKADAIFIGFDWVTHSDLVKRIKDGKPFDNAPAFHLLQAGQDEDWSKGYTDYPPASY